jgi:tetratricopeptide (TPR) repeat protein
MRAIHIVLFAALSSAAACWAAPTGPACDTRDYRQHALDADWAYALKVSDSCVAEFDAKLKERDPLKDTFGVITIGSAAEWRRIHAQLYALLGDFQRAETERAEAYSLFESYIPHKSDGMFTQINDLSDASTKAFILERQGRYTDAIAAYSGLPIKATDTPRLGVLLFKTGDMGGAGAWATYGDTISSHKDATAFYVLGLLAERKGDKTGAAADFLKAQEALKQTLGNNADGPLHDYADVPDISAALQRVTAPAP